MLLAAACAVGALARVAARMLNHPASPEQTAPSRNAPPVKGPMKTANNTATPRTKNESHVNSRRKNAIAPCLIAAAISTTCAGPGSCRRTARS